MDKTEVEKYLHEHIPLSAAMEVSVESLDTNSAALSAPLQPNINHRESVFGGSLSALAILCAWTYLHNRLEAEGIAARLVIQRNSVEYEEPALGRFCAMLENVSDADWLRFIRMIERKGKGRIQVSANLTAVDGGAPLGCFEGTFVAVKMN